MKTKFVIIGGGVAGLCAAIRLSELGEETLLIEGGAYPSHKICGEFLSPECLPYLAKWNIHPVAISGLVFNTIGNTSLTLPFPSSAGGLSHIQLDPALAKLASERGVKIMTNTQVVSFKAKTSSGDPHLIKLSNDETIEASNVIIATGRIPGFSIQKPIMRYMGFKAHFKLNCQEKDLQMFSVPGAYLGVSPIEDNTFNVACLADLKTIGNHSPQDFIKNLISQNAKLRELFIDGENLFDQWMTASVPAFGVKHIPDWQDTYFIGDAAMTIPPACGDGLSMAIFGGRLAAEYALKGKVQEFKTVWAKRCAAQMFWAKALHRLMLSPTLNRPVIGMAQYFPIIAEKLFELTRQSPV